MRGCIHHTFWYRDGDMGFVLQDAVMKMNHSFTPNVHTVNNKEKNWKALKIVASRDIKAGEELCSNYSFGSKQNAGWFTELVEEYDPERLQLEYDLKISPKETPC